MTTTPRTRFRALSHLQRRRVLVELRQANPRDDTPSDIGDPEPANEAVELLLDFQNYHLPELEDDGFIDYDRENNVVTRGPSFEEIEPVLALIDEHRADLPDDWLPTTPSDRDETFISFDESGLDRPSLVVCEAVAEVAERDSSELPTLQRSVDTDALNSLFSAGAPGAGEDIRLAFTHAGMRVVVDTEGVLVQPKNRS